MEFAPPYRHLRQSIGRIHHLLPILTRDPQYEMHADRNIFTNRPLDCVHCSAAGMSAAQKFKALVMNRLHADLKPELESILLIRGYEIQGLIREAVGPRSDHEAYDVPLSNRLIVQPFQLSRGRVGVGVCLEVCYESGAGVNALEIFSCGFHL